MVGLRGTVVLAVLVPLGVAWGAEEEQKEPEERPATISLEFPGGTAREYVEAVKSTSGANVVSVPSDLEEVRMPAVNVRNVSVETALELLAATSEESAGRILVTAMGGGEGERVYVIKVRREQSSSRPEPAPSEREVEARRRTILENEQQLLRRKQELELELVKKLPLYSENSDVVKQLRQSIARLQTLDRLQEVGSHPRRLAVYPLKDVRGGAESALKAADAALSLLGLEDGEKATVKFHEDSQLLMVHGTEEQHAAIEQVLDGLREPEKPEKDLRALQALDLRLAYESQQNAALRKEIADLKEELARLKSEKPSQPAK